MKRDQAGRVILSERQEFAVELRAKGLSPEQTARALGLDPDLVLSWERRPRYRVALQERRATPDRNVFLDLLMRSLENDNEEDLDE